MKKLIISLIVLATAFTVAKADPIWSHHTNAATLNLGKLHMEVIGDANSPTGFLGVTSRDTSSLVRCAFNYALTQDQWTNLDNVIQSHSAIDIPVPKTTNVVALENFLVKNVTNINAIIGTDFYTGTTNRFLPHDAKNMQLAYDSWVSTATNEADKTFVANSMSFGLGAWVTLSSTEYPMLGQPATTIYSPNITTTNW